MLRKSPAVRPSETDGVNKIALGSYQTTKLAIDRAPYAPRVEIESGKLVGNPCVQLVRAPRSLRKEESVRSRLRVTHMCCCVSLVTCVEGRGGLDATCHVYGPIHSRRAAHGAACVGVACVVYGQAARARRLFCNEIYNYNCKLTLSSGPESRSYGISINYRFNLRPMSAIRTIDHMIDSGWQGHGNDIETPCPLPLAN